MGKFFGGLPKYVLLPILIDWLVMNDVGSLDSALCNKVQRKLFLEWLGGAHSVTLSGIMHEKYNGVGYWQWLSIRNIHVHHIGLFFEYFMRDMCRKVIRKTYWEEFLYLTCGSQHDNTLNEVVTTEMALPDKVNSLTITSLGDKDMGRFSRLNPVCLLSLSLIDFDVNNSYNLTTVVSFVSKHCPTLQELSIHGCGDIPTRALKSILSTATNLVRLSLVERNYICASKATYSGEEDFSDWQVNCTKLQYLSLYQISWGCDALFSLITSRCPDLQHLALLLMNFDGAIVADIAVHCRKLISLSLEMAIETPIPLSAYQMLAEHCSHLEYFNFQSIRMHTDTVPGVQLLLSHCPGLRFINAHFCAYNWTGPVPEGVEFAICRRLSGRYDPYKQFSKKQT